MRIVALVFVVGIVYLVYGKNEGKQSPQDRLDEARDEAAQVQPEPLHPTTAAVSGSLRAPIDRTRQALESVKIRNTE